MTFDIYKDTVRDFITVSVAKTRNALASVHEKHGMFIEGTTALPKATLLQAGKADLNQVVVLVISGREINIDRFKKSLVRIARRHKLQSYAVQMIRVKANLSIEAVKTTRTPSCFPNFLLSL